MEGMVLALLSFLTLLLIAVLSFVLAKKIKFPYTLFLVFVGTILAFLAKFQPFEFLTAFHLSPELLFYVFLPTLLFEAAYNIKLDKFLESVKSIFSLAILGLIISTLIIGFGLHWLLLLFGVEIPLVVTMLFGAIISATDPVAVISMFKEYSAPKRLALIFEGESLFNDGTAVALFVVLLGVIAEGGILNADSILNGFGLFVSMIGLGILFGIVFGGIFSKLLDYALNEKLQITLSLLVAHFTFLISEIIYEHLNIPISAIIATVVASIIMGNYGRYKLTPKVERYMDNFWDYFAFISNSIVFLLLGFLLTEINFSGGAILLPIILAILITAIARAISVYSSLYFLKFQKKEKQIPKSWQHLLSWGSLRGALAITMVLLIPDDLSLEAWNYPMSIKDFVMALVIGSIYFTLFVKGLTIGKMIKKLGITEVNSFERMEYLEGKIILFRNLKKALENEFEKGNLSERDYNEKIIRINASISNLEDDISNYDKKNSDYLKRMIQSYALGVEKRKLEDIYSNNEITEKGYKKLLNKLEIQEKMIENFSELKSFDQIGNNDILDKILMKMNSFFKGKENAFSIKDKYFYYKALSLTAKEVVRALNKIKKEDRLLAKREDIDDLIFKYQEFATRSEEKLRELINGNVDFELEERRYMKDKMAVWENEILDELADKHFICQKVKDILNSEIKKEIEKII